MTTPVPPRLEPAIRTALAPMLREDGFRGSGRKFYGQSGSWLTLLNVQGSRYGGSFAINLAVHFAAAPDLIGNTPEPARMTEAHCEFRRRLSQDRGDMWWEHEGSGESMLEAVKAAAEMYASVGRRCFSSVIGALDVITPKSLAEGDYDLHGFHTGKPRLGLALARIRMLQGQVAESRAFARFALEHLEVAVAWRGELEALAANDA